MTFATVAMVAATFNLVCTATETYSDTLAEKSAQQRQRVDVYRIDLTKRLWCSGPCTESRRLHAVLSDKIVLVNNANDSGDWHMIEVHRESGKYQYHLVLANRFSTRTGACEPTEFTGLPKRKF